MKRIAGLLAMLALFCWITGCKELPMRRDMPFQEIIPLDRGIAVINAQQWFPRNLNIHCYSGSGTMREASYDDKGICLIQGLDNDKEYTVEIRRTDLKGMILYKKAMVRVTPRAGGAEYIVLVGASVGKAWHFDKLPERLNLGPRFIFGNRTIYDFDKTSAIRQLAVMPVPVSGVIIKECAAYFPRDIDASRKQIIDWVAMLREHKRTPILATVVPVTEAHSREHPGRLQSILKFNDFIRQYAASEGITVVDLEKAVRVSETDRHLRQDFAQEDGLHLVKKAYDEALDAIPLPLASTPE